MSLQMHLVTFKLFTFLKCIIVVYSKIKRIQNDF